MIIFYQLKGLIGVETPLKKGGWGGDFLSNVVGLEEQFYNKKLQQFQIKIYKYDAQDLSNQELIQKPWFELS